jgi:hypothetical protein
VLLQSIETHVDSAFRAEAHPAGPSCGCDPLQRCTTNRCITVSAWVIPIRALPAQSFEVNRVMGRGALRSFIDRPPRNRSSGERWQRSASPAVTPTSGCNPTWPAGRTTSFAGSTDSAIRRSRSREARPGGRGRQLSWSLLPLRRLSPSESTPPRFANTGYVPSTGFLTLSTAFSSLERPALFHADSAHGVRPTGSSPHCQVPLLVAPGLPSWRCSSARTVSHMNVS